MNGQEPFPELLVRPIRPDDSVRLQRTFERLSPETIYRRFFSPIHTPPPGTLHRLANVDHDTARPSSSLTATRSSPSADGNAMPDTPTTPNWHCWSRMPGSVGAWAGP